MVAFLLSAKNGQFDDSYTPSIRMLLDDTVQEEEKSNNEKS